MKILVCISNVPDTTTSIQIGPDGKSADLSQVKWIINPWDELALTRAVELREKHGDVFESLTVISVGEKEADGTLRKALAVGADRAIRVDTAATGNFQVAHQIAEVIKKEGFDLVLTGIESSDFNGSATGFILGYLCGMPVASNVSSLTVEQGKITLVQETDSGRETVSMTPPLLAVVQKGIAIEPKIPAMRGIMLARNKPLDVVQAVEYNSADQITAMELPPPKEACKMIDEDNIGELVQLLQNESKVI